MSDMPRDDDQPPKGSTMDAPPPPPFAPDLALIDLLERGSRMTDAKIHAMFRGYAESETSEA